MTTSDDGLLSIMYSSTAHEPFDDDRLNELLAQSRSSNEKLNLTGMLLYRSGRFIQVLEGDEFDVRKVIAKIENDPRHTDMRILVEETVSSRRFPDWTMGYEPMAESREPAPEGFRSTFEDLENGADPVSTIRAARELSLWFRVRSMRRANRESQSAN
ncbi:BLUF domain-containing protein [Humidisolicoccus flavus]|uniref:BLUF domain-containing protein n=1 Tax=Humidisolicoccus flavus TaxID=3111414 RepID=UPI003252B79C